MQDADRDNSRYDCPVIDKQPVYRQYFQAGRRMTEPDELDPVSAEKINLETSLIAWKELEKFFASGATIKVDANLDLIQVALEMAKDNTELISNWMSENKLAPVSDRQAQNWHDENRSVWAVIIKPWVLVQDKQGPKNSGD